MFAYTVVVAIYVSINRSSGIFGVEFRAREKFVAVLARTFSAEFRPLDELQFGKRRTLVVVPNFGGRIFGVSLHWRQHWLRVCSSANVIHFADVQYERDFARTHVVARDIYSS